MSVIIREVRRDEVAALSALARRVYADTFGHSMSAADLETQLRETRSEAYFRKAVLTDTILVALKDDALAGYVQLSDVRIPGLALTATDLELHALYVDTSLQGHGIGRALMDAALAHPRFMHAPIVYLDVWDQNVRAVGLYKRYGFRVVGRRDVPVAGRVIGTDLVMVRSQR